MIKIKVTIFKKLANLSINLYVFSEYKVTQVFIIVNFTEPEQLLLLLAYMEITGMIIFLGPLPAL